MTSNPVVLFVDDEPDITEGLRLSLRKQPLTIETANSARAALDILAERPVDVVVSDERMPRMTGSEFLARVRQNWPSVQRIILTGEASIQAAIAAINDAAIYRFLQKPCSPEELVEAIFGALAARDQAASGSVSVDPLLAAAFDEALEQCFMVYQPIVTLPGRRIHAYEALARVDHPRIGNPAELIRAATLLDRRFDFDRRVRDLVARDADDVPGDSLLFVNILPESLADDDLVSGRGALAQHRDRVVLEVTERAALSTIDDVEARLDALRALGYRLALDDLGAGYAGLSSLVTMKPDIVKFDMELVRDIDRSRERSSLVSAMVVVCRDLGALTLGEGIETEAEMAHLGALGIDLFQGYLIAKPEHPFVSF